MISFKGLAIGTLFLLGTLVGIFLLAYDAPLRITPNYHWDFVLVCTVVDAILGMQAVLTSALGQWEKGIIRAAAFWSILIMIAIVGDVALRLQLPSDYPPVTELQAFEYLFLGLNGNPLPLSVPTLFTLHAVAALVGLLPRKIPWFQLGIWPTRRTTLAIILIVVVVMGMRPTAVLLASSGILPVSSSALTNSTDIILTPVQHHELPYNPLNKTAFVTLVAVANPMLPYNFNDTRFGQIVIYVPANWTVTLVFINREGFPHSAVLMQATGPSPTVIEPSANILGQIPRDAVNGGFMLQNESGTVTVNNISAGNYWIVCAFNYPVPHAEEGMWVTLEVTNQLSAPYYEILPG
jgi:sulfocyanin